MSVIDAYTPYNPQEPESGHDDQLDESFEHRVQAEIRRRDVRREADRRQAAETVRPGFDSQLLSNIAEERVCWRVEGLLAVAGRMLVSAQHKTGKTTFALNLARALIRGGSFLGQFQVDPIDGRVAFLNFEVSRAQLAAWAREADIPGDKMLLVNLRGRSNPFRDPADRSRLADELRAYNCEFAVIDPFGRAFPGDSQNVAGQVGSFLATLDEWAVEAGLEEYALVAHAGWDAERTRGSTALEDWPDVIVRLTKDDAGNRYLSAFGRDVEIDEDQLDYEPASRRLSLSGSGNRRQAKAETHQAVLLDAVVEVVGGNPGTSVTDLSQLLREAGHGHQRGEVSHALKTAVSRGLIRQVKGGRNALLNYPIEAVVPSSPEQSRRDLVSSPDPSYRDGSTTTTTRDPEPSGLLDWRADAAN